MQTHDPRSASAGCFVALELSRSKWLLGALLPGQEKVLTVSVSGGDTDGLIKALADIADKAARRGYPDVRPRVCFEAGYDGLWLARFLTDRGIDVTVLDAASFLVSRRGRRVKPDRIDVGAMVFTLKAFHLGDKSVCRAVRVSSPDEENAKRVSRERSQLVKERTRNFNRIRGLLNLHGIRSVQGLHGGEWRCWLDRVRTGDGRPLGCHLLRELTRQFERLHLVIAHLKALDTERAAIAELHDPVPCGQKIAMLRRLRGLGEGGATTLVAEVFCRHVQNRRHLGSYLGLAPSHYASRDLLRDQGISKAGNKPARVMMVELAWCWLRYQPQIQLALWYRERSAGQAGRFGKVGIVALARKLAIALWRFVEDGLVSIGARMKIA